MKEDGKDQSEHQGGVAHLPTQKRPPQHASGKEPATVKGVLGGLLIFAAIMGIVIGTIVGIRWAFTVPLG